MPGSCAVCGQPSSSICGGCKRLFYCSKEHQKLHWMKEHKGCCRAVYKLEQNDRLGRYLIASENISKGDVIFYESPLIVGPKTVTVPVCLGCHNVCNMDNYHECDGCGFPLCSPQCQVSDNHVDECYQMMKSNYRIKMDSKKKNNDDDNNGGGKEIFYFPIVPLRCILLKGKKSYSEKYKKIMNLESHYDDRINKPLFDLYKKNVADFIRERLKMDDVDEKEILTITGILDTNAFEIVKNNVKLRGLYNVSSMLSHDCKPNTKHGFLQPDMTIVVTATRDIKSGELITATYTQTFWNTLSRREHLKTIKCFDCVCERCSDPSELGTYAGAIRCSKCTMTSDKNSVENCYVIPVDPLNSNSVWKCMNCQREMSRKQIKMGNDILKNELTKSNVKTVTGLEQFLIKYGVYENGVLHSNNYHVVQVKHALIRLIGNTDGYTYSGE